MKAFHVLIPARYQSSRLPGKLLLELEGKTVLERTYHQATLSGAKTITIATDHEVIYQLAKSLGASVVMTGDHLTGTDRIAEAVEILNFDASEIVVNVQGDEPLIQPQLIQQVAQSLMDSHIPLATLCWPIEDEESFLNPNVVKVVRDRDHVALYFSRSPIPFYRDKTHCFDHTFRHIGLYAYRVAFLKEIVRMPVCELENIECLEQLRVLWEGHRIKVETAVVRPLQDVNTKEDLERARRQLQEARVAS